MNENERFHLKTDQSRIGARANEFLKRGKINLRISGLGAIGTAVEIAAIKPSFQSITAEGGLVLVTVGLSATALAVKFYRSYQYDKCIEDFKSVSNRLERIR